MSRVIWAAVAAAVISCAGCDLSLVDNHSIADADADIDQLPCSGACGSDGTTSDGVVGLACQASANQSEAICDWASGPARASLVATDGSGREVRGLIARGAAWDIVPSDAPTTWTICANGDSPGDANSECASVSLES